jgi:hypothetical protein
MHGMRKKFKKLLNSQFSAHEMCNLGNSTLDESFLFVLANVICGDTIALPWQDG